MVSYSYLMRTLIYDSWFKTTEETTKALAWISFPNLLPTYFAKECLFSLAFVVGKPVQLDLAIINRTRPSCARVKVLVDLKGEFPKSVIMDIVNEATGKIKKEVVIINMITSPKESTSSADNSPNNSKDEVQSGDFFNQLQEEVDYGITDPNKIAMGVVETEEFDELWDIPLEAHISPKLLKSARKGKNHENGENTQPTRIQPKRNKAYPKFQ
ncbi:hypothetical protein H5410_001227 [Solanum commersonii]|uniref:DUF4283 domain-containing protein n=1 Tax=Solanum commersonii TaxID=4109 RepID=A0A9J6AYB6_SOLCO|nr:hypothetical protein H5410_001227 [Solanum commersonii]